MVRPLPVVELQVGIDPRSGGDGEYCAARSPVLYNKADADRRPARAESMMATRYRKPFAMGM